jgi:hypothetical protein
MSGFAEPEMLPSHPLTSCQKGAIAYGRLKRAPARGQIFIPLISKPRTIFKISAGVYSWGTASFSGVAMSKSEYERKAGESRGVPFDLAGPSLHERFRDGLRFALFSVAVVAVLLAACWYFGLY